MYVNLDTAVTVDDVGIRSTSEININESDSENVSEEKCVKSHDDSIVLLAESKKDRNEDTTNKNVEDVYEDNYTDNSDIDQVSDLEMNKKYVCPEGDIISADQDDTVRPETCVLNNFMENQTDYLKACGIQDYNVKDDKTDYESDDEYIKSNVQSKVENDQLQLDDAEIQVNNSSTDQIQGFVSFLCKRMLPTQQSMSEFSGIKHWQLTVRNMLTMAAEVCTDSEALHSLRLCNDIVTDIILPYNLTLESLYDIGNSLVYSSVDSDEVFSDLLKLFKCLKGTESAAPIQRVICQFLIRCLSTNTETNAFIYLFNAIEESLIPEEEMHLLKAPLRFLIEQELDENETVLKDLAESGENRDILIESSLFLSSLDSCLCNLYEQKRIESPFVLLIVDLIQETFVIDEDTANTCDTLLSTGQILQEDKIGLAFVTALAYSKAAISYITKVISCLSQSENDILKLLTQLNAVLCGLKDTDIYKPMLDCFLAGLGKNSSICSVRKYCNGQSMDDSFLEKIDWNDEYLSNSFESNPLAIEIPKEMLLEGEGFLSKEKSIQDFSNNVSQLMKIVISQPVCGLLLLYSLTMKKWYLSRHRKMLDDIDRSHSVQLLEEMKQLKISPEQHKLIECLIGKQDFMSSLFMPGEESSFQQYMICSVLVSTFARVLAYCNGSVGHSSSLLSICLLKAKEMKRCVFARSSDSDEYEKAQQNSTSFQDNGIFALCKCNRRLFFYGEDIVVCPVCGNEPVIDEIKISSNKGLSSLSYYSSFISVFCFQMNILTDIPLNILMFLVKGCLLGSVSLGICKCSEIEDIFANECAAIDVSQRLESEINNEWEDLKKSLNMDDHDVGIILHSVLNKGNALLFEEKYSTLSESQKIQWESNFCSLVSGILDERAETIRQSLYQCNDRYNLPRQCAEIAMREAINFENVEEDPQNYAQLSALFRSTVQPSREDFKSQLYFHRRNFPFLIIYFQNKKEFDMPKHIYHIVQWHMATVVNISHLFKRTECLKMTVAEFHKNLSDLKKQKMSKKKFENFKNSWKIVMELLENTDEFSTVMPIDSKSTMAECLILDTTCDVYKVLSFLVSIQNDLIDLALQHSFTCDNLQFLLRDTGVACCKAVPVTELKMEQLIDLSFDLGESLAQESNSGLAYGLGKQIFYDFQNIEKEICVDLLSGKAYVSLEGLPRVVFADELYKNFVALLTEVNLSIPQETLPIDIEVAFVKVNQDIANMSFELINYLDMVLTLLKQSKCDPQKSLIEFVKERANIVGQQFPSHYLPSPESRIKVCHILSLHELLEEMCVDRIVDSLADAYKTELDTDMKDHFSKMSVGSIKKSEIVTKAMKKFIYRCIFMGDIDSEQRLIQYLSHESFWPLQFFQNERLTIEGFKEEVKDIIPPCLLVCHIVAALSTLSENIEAQKQGEMRMDHVIASWKEKKPENTAKVTRQRKAVKKLRKT